VKKELKFNVYNQL